MGAISFSLRVAMTCCKEKQRAGSGQARGAAVRALKRGGTCHRQALAEESAASHRCRLVHFGQRRPAARAPRRLPPPLPARPGTCPSSAAEGSGSRSCPRSLGLSEGLKAGTGYFGSRQQTGRLLAEFPELPTGGTNTFCIRGSLAGTARRNARQGAGPGRR